MISIKNNALSKSLLILLIAVGCTSQPTFSVQPTYTILPTYTPVIHTPILEPILSPTPDLHFWNLMPDTLDLCLKLNVVNWETRETDLAVLMDKVKYSPTTSTYELTIEDFPMFHADFHEETIKGEYSQFARFSWMDKERGIVFDACAALIMPDGEKLGLFILPIRRNGNITLDRIAIAVDLNWKSDPGLSWDELYVGMRNGTCEFVWIPLLLKHQGNPWGYPRKKYLIDLIPEESEKAKEYFQNLKKYFDPNIDLSIEEWNSLRTYMSVRIFPVIGFHCQLKSN